MSRENVDVVRDLYAGWSEGDFRGGLDAFHPDLRFVVSAAVSVTPGEWEGIEGMRAAWRDGLRAWSGYRTGPIEHLLESGSEVIAFNRLHGVGRWKRWSWSPTPG